LACCTIDREKDERIPRDVFAFSEWTNGNDPERPFLKGEIDFPLPRQTWTIEVPYERRKPYPEHPKTLAEHIRKKRIESGLTQKALGELLKVAECTVYNWEHGIGPRGGLKRRVESYLNGSPISHNTEPGS
jgi:DNA-binding XRE family transcriptional regulator